MQRKNIFKGSTCKKGRESKEQGRKGRRKKGEERKEQGRKGRRKQGEERKEKEEERKEKKEKKRRKKERKRKWKKGKKKKKKEKERNNKKEDKTKTTNLNHLLFYVVLYAIQLSFQDGMSSLRCGPRFARHAVLERKLYSI